MTDDRNPDGEQQPMHSDHDDKPRDDEPRDDKPRDDGPRDDGTVGAPHGDGSRSDETPDETPEGSDGTTRLLGLPGLLSSGPDGPGPVGSGPDVPGPGDLGPLDPETELSPEEEALRRLLKDVTQDIAPAPEALAHLRRAVPARRARRRQALVGVAAACLLLGTAVPSVFRAATTTTAADAGPSHSAGRHEAAGGPTGAQDGGDPDKGGKVEEKKPDASRSHKADEKKDKGSGSPKGTGGSAPDSTGPDPSDTMAATAPSCGRDQLDQASASTDGGDGTGTVYGWFRVVNVSGQTCAVDGGGRVDASPQGGADGTRIQVVDHTSGDPAVNLPDPGLAPGRVILTPGSAYQVKFAWIPASGGGTTGCQTTAEPPPSETGGTEGGDAGQESQTAAAVEEPATTTPASVLLSHTPEAGAPVAASVTIDGACAGTVYRTSVLAG
ncbi:hypothetical protein GCM10010406_54030 [Streptomyces thermolineatus]|uniref:DUF4232 domain-containing protein n=1 Tax=Streptomyces thermolineatus TaxID=44033 RepID=A0ABP6A7X9_9ACTN